jgi:hypothetical protein
VIFCDVYVLLSLLSIRRNLIFYKMFELVFILTLAGSVNIDVTCASTDESVSNVFYDTSLLDCKACDIGQIVDNTGYSCVCEPGAAKTETTRDLPVFTCVACASGAPSSDDYLC